MTRTVSLKKPHEFRRLYAKGKSAAGRFFVVYCRRNGGAVNRLGITVSTKIGGAVTRNRVRRRIREAYRLGEGRLRHGFDIVFVARRDAFDAPFDAMRAELDRITSRLNLLEEADGDAPRVSPGGRPVRRGNEGARDVNGRSS